MKSVEKAMSENSQDWSSPENRGLLSELSSLATEATSRDYSTKKTSRSARKGARYLRRLGSELSATVADKDEK